MEKQFDGVDSWYYSKMPRVSWTITQNVMKRKQFVFLIIWHYRYS